MSMLEWAEREIEIAKKQERCGVESDEWNYGCACYDSALRAFKSLLGDGHSGFSISVTKQILNRLIEGNPLTPIQGTEDEWEYLDTDEKHGYKRYKNKRCSRLFKNVYKDGSVEYRDYEYVTCYNPDSDVYFINGFITSIILEMYPITMPYIPDNNILVCVEEFLFDRKNGDYDTMGILYCDKDRKRIEINRYFKENEHSFEEITKEEYDERKRNQVHIKK